MELIPSESIHLGCRYADGRLLTRLMRPRIRIALKTLQGPGFK
jgi:hypothetical protein